MSDILNTSEFNAMFAAALNGGGEAMEKLGEATGLYIQDKLRENSFARKILPPQTVTESELTRNVSDEGLSFIDDIEPDSIAMRVNWRGEPNRTYLQGKRYEIKLSTVSSERFQKSEQELRSYKMPLTKIIEQNTVKDMQEQIDVTFMKHVKAGIFLATESRYRTLVDRGVITTADGGTSGRFASVDNFAEYISSPNACTATPFAGAVGDAATYKANLHQFSNIILANSDVFNRDVLRDVIKVHASRQLKARCFLMHESTWNDTIAWSQNEAGLEVTSEIVKDGYKYTTVAGYTFVTTVRDNPDIVAPGQIFVFPSPEFLGRYLILENTKFWISKQGRFITMEAWEDSGIGFGNIKGLACILLKGATINLPARFSGDATHVGVAVTNAIGAAAGANTVGDVTAPLTSI
jgi:hypothetical protein